VQLEDDGNLLPGETAVEGYGALDILDLLELLGIDVADGVENCTRSAAVRYANDSKRK
jgi:hypothetical protein